MTNLKLPNLSYNNLVRIHNARVHGGVQKLAYATTLEFFYGTAIICHHDSVIAEITPTTIDASTAGWASRTTVHRIDRVLLDNNTNFRAAIRQGEATLFHVSAFGDWARIGEFGYASFRKTYYGWIVTDRS